MKVDRLITCLNNNDIYTGFWNAFSPVWSKKFNLRPTLVFLGSEQELRSNNLSEEYGDIIRLDPVPEVTVDHRLDWSVTWALFYAASQFQEDVCMLQGIDQMPLSNFFFDQIKDVDEDKYVIGFADAYEGYSPAQLGYHNLTNSFYPSSHHVAKGKWYKNIYSIDDDWSSEVKKVFQTRSSYHLPQNLWGLDECYSSKLISKFEQEVDSEKFHKCRFFKDFWFKSRIDRIWHMTPQGLQYDKERLKSGGYSEFHSPRPYYQYSQEINKVIKDLMES